MLLLGLVLHHSNRSQTKAEGFSGGGRDYSEQLDESPSWANLPQHSEVEHGLFPFSHMVQSVGRRAAG